MPGTHITGGNWTTQITGTQKHRKETTTGGNSEIHRGQFSEYETKDNTLAKAWKKKIEVDGRQIFFDHDYPIEVMKKCKSYTEIKKILKDKKIRFQTPLRRMHWSDGPRSTTVLKMQHETWEEEGWRYRRGVTADPPWRRVKQWMNKGITAICTMMEQGELQSFEKLRGKFGLDEH